MVCANCISIKKYNVNPQLEINQRLIGTVHFSQLPLSYRHTFTLGYTLVESNAEENCSYYLFYPVLPPSFLSL